MSSFVIEKDSLMKVKKVSNKKEIQNKKRWTSFLCTFGIFTMITISSLIGLYLITKNIYVINIWPITLILVSICVVYCFISDLRILLKKKKYNKKTKIVNNKKLIFNI